MTICWMSYRKSDPSSAEVVDARMNAAGTTYQSLKIRLDTGDDALLNLKSDI